MTNRFTDKEIKTISTKLSKVDTSLTLKASQIIKQLLEEREGYKNLIGEAVKLLESSDKHKWKCINVGMYDSIYECVVCGAQHMEQADNPDTWLNRQISICKK